MNPLASHWFRLAGWLFLAAPIIALLIVPAADVPFTFALVITLYIWGLVCVILALIAFAGLLLRLVGWGIRAIRR